MKSTWEGILASIFHRFWWILGAKLGGKFEPKSIKNRLKIEIQDRLPLGIDFSSILVGFGRQVGTENRAKID